MKRVITIFLALAMVFSLAACAGPAAQGASQEPDSGAPESTNAAKPSVPAENESFPVPAAGQEGNESNDDEGGNSNMLVAVFSLAGEQYNVGVIEEGNTAVIAKMIAEQTGADLFEIEAATPYPDTYDGLLDISRQEMNEDARPEIVGTVDDMDQYDVVFLGYPNWWGDMPMIVYSFLESYDFSGKTIVPFCTNEGSGLSGTERSIGEVTGAEVRDGLSIRGATAQNRRDEAESAVADWLGEGGFLD